MRHDSTTKDDNENPIRIVRGADGEKFQIMRPQALIQYTNNAGRHCQLDVCFHPGGVLQLIRTLRWCFFNGIAVSIAYLPREDEL